MERWCPLSRPLWLLIVLHGLLGAAALGGQPPAAELEPIRVEYFFEPGCSDCDAVRDQVLPAIEQRFEGSYRWIERDVGVASNRALLLRCQEALGVHGNETVCVIVEDRYVYNGLAAIRTGLVDRLETLLTERVNAQWVPTPMTPPVSEEESVSIAARRIRNATIAAILLAGLGDGVNPCAISTLVFFMSLLTLSRARRRTVWLMGGAFCLASFLTYTALGFGLLRVLHLLSGFSRIQWGLKVGLMALLVVLAFLSFRDALRYARTGHAQGVTLQLPDRVKGAIHGILRWGVDARGALLGGLAAGALVTALESVCTGQMYVPALTLVVRSGVAPLESFGLLLLYNLMFILPLVVAFLLVERGLRMPSLLEWSRRNVVPSKIFLGLLFLALAGLLAIL